MEVVSFEHLYVEKLFHGTRVEVAPNIVLDGLDTRYSKGGSRTHMNFVSDFTAVKRGRPRPGWRTGSTAVVEVPLAGLLRAGIEVFYTKNHAYVTEGINGRIPAALISAVRRMEDMEILYPPPEVATALAIRREQAHNM